MSDDVQEMSTSVRWFLDALATAAAPFGLSSAVIVLQSVWEHVGLCKVNKAQLTLLAHSSCVATDGLVKARRHDVADESVMTDFDRLLRKVETFVVKQSSTHLLKTVLRAKDTELQIAQLHDQIQHHMAAFGMSAQITAAAQRQRLADCQKADLQALEALLKTMSGRFDSLEENLDLNHQSEMAVMQSLQIGMRSVGSSNVQIRDALSAILSCLQRRSGTSLPPTDSHTITSFDIDRQERIGRGGFSQVFRGSWRGTDVAVKVLHPPIDQKMIMREVKVWNGLRHPHIIPMFGASIYEDPPFIVMPYMQHGDILTYLEEHNPHANRASQIAKGLDYLHSRDVIHGDLKALNVLIDDAGAVKLADFGLTRIKSVVTTSAAAPQSAFGSPRWMAPERLLGGQLDCPVDVYALAITFYEVFTMETPLGAVDDSRLIELVCDRHVRPARPRTFANGLDEELWRLMEEAWAPRPEARPSALAIAERTAALAARFSTGQDWRVDDWRSIPQKDGAMTMPTPHVVRPADDPPPIYRNASYGSDPTYFHGHSPGLAVRPNPRLADTVESSPMADSRGPHFGGMPQQPMYASTSSWSHSLAPTDSRTSEVHSSPVQWPASPHSGSFSMTSSPVPATFPMPPPPMPSVSPMPSAPPPMPSVPAMPSVSPVPSVPYVPVARRSLASSVEVAGMDLSEVLPSLGFGKVPIVLGKCCPFICEKAYRHMLDAVQREKGAFVSAFTSKSQNVFARLPTIFDGRPFTPRQRALAKVFGTGPSFGRDLDWSAPVPSGAGVGTSETDQGFGAPMAKVASPVSVDGKGIVEQLTKVSLGDKDLFTAMDAAAVMFDYLRSLPGPIIPVDVGESLIQLIPDRSKKSTKKKIHHQIGLLPSPERPTLLLLLRTIEKVSQDQDVILDRLVDRFQPVVVAGAKVDGPQGPARETLRYLLKHRKSFVK